MFCRSPSGLYPRSCAEWQHVGGWSSTTLKSVREVDGHAQADEARLAREQCTAPCQADTVAVWTRSAATGTSLSTQVVKGESHPEWAKRL